MGVYCQNLKPLKLTVKMTKLTFLLMKNNLHKILHLWVCPTTPNGNIGSRVVVVFCRQRQTNNISYLDGTFKIEITVIRLQRNR